MSAGEKVIHGLEEAAFVERVRTDLFPNLAHYRQHCISETDDAVEVAKFLEAEIKRRFFR